MPGDIQGLRGVILSNARAVFAPRFESDQIKRDPAKLDIIIVRHEDTGGYFAMVTYDNKENVAEGSEAETVQEALEILMRRMVDATGNSEHIKLVHDEFDWVYKDFGLS